MNNKITKVLLVLQIGDIQEYFNEVNKIIQLNYCIHYNKMLIQEYYDKQTPITYNQYTKFHLSDTGLEIINITKSNITETMIYKLKWEGNNTLQGNLFENTLEQFKLFKLFVYIKNDTHNFDTYRIYINH